MKKHLAALAVFGSLLSGQAFAADLYVPPVETYEPELATWSTCYVGVPISWSTGTTTASAPLSENTSPLNGFPVGIQAGCDWQLDDSPIVLGIITDVFVNGPGGSVGPYPLPAFPAVTVTSTTNIPVFGTLRGRAGFAADNTLFYLTGGLAVASVNKTIATNAPASASLSNTHVGWTVGAGVEHKVTDNISLFAEYGYYDLGTRAYDYTGAVTFGTPLNLTPRFHQIKVGANYRF